MNHKESKFSTRDGINIFYQIWRPEGTPKGIVQLVHGIAEHSGRYMHVVSKLISDDFIVYAADHRGHGRSDGHPGYVNSFYDFVHDQKDFTEVIREKEGNIIPLFLLGHSMGSPISILYTADYPDEFTGLILSGAGTKPGEGVNFFIILLARTLSKILPKFSLKNELSDGVSRDPTVKEAYNNDPNVLKKVTARLGNEVFKGFKEATHRISDIKIPLLIQKGQEDPIIINVDELFDNVTVEDKTLKIYDGLYHEVYNELEEDRIIVLKDLSEWLNAHL
ncbi:MAG: alpha/beta hydrolase [Candidatus Hodarchaeales archaeon]|jgi:alpha-beta hydrolase superfamily lysophospholipase